MPQCSAVVGQVGPKLFRTLRRTSIRADWNVHTRDKRLLIAETHCVAALPPRSTYRNPCRTWHRHGFPCRNLGSGSPCFLPHRLQHLRCRLAPTLVPTRYREKSISGETCGLTHKYNMPNASRTQSRAAGDCRERSANENHCCWQSNPPETKYVVKDNPKPLLVGTSLTSASIHHAFLRAMGIT